MAKTYYCKSCDSTFDEPEIDTYEEEVCPICFSNEFVKQDNVDSENA